MTLLTATALDPATEVWQDDAGFELESGQVLEGLSIAYRTWGELNAAADNVVLVCHALTGSADADQWWPGLIGPGCALDPEKDFIVCSNVLGGCYGSSGPLYPVSARDGRTLGLDFPEVTVRDIVRAQRRLVDALGVRRLQLVIGPSLGGMQVLEWAATYPELVSSIAPIGTSARHSAWCMGIGEAQRAAIESDPRWCDGRYDADSPPASGLATARMMAMVSYRSFANFESRFARHEDQSRDFEVHRYLRYQGDKLVGRFDAASYYRLTQAMDTHDVGRGRGGTPQVLASITCPALVVSVTSDVLYLPEEQQFIADHLANAELEVLDSPHGHDGFLIETDALGEMVKDFRRRIEPSSSTRLSA